MLSMWFLASTFFATTGYVSYKKKNIADDIYIDVVKGRKKIMIITIIKTSILIIVTTGLIVIQIIL